MLTHHLATKLFLHWILGAESVTNLTALSDLFFVFSLGNRDDQILFNSILFYVGYWALESAKHMPLWRADGLLFMFLLHAGPVEFLYYWLHRALHHHFLYSRYHSHHHSSIVTEPITCKYSHTYINIS